MRDYLEMVLEMIGIMGKKDMINYIYGGIYNFKQLNIIFYIILK